jgi:hypothetical protein
MCKLMRPVAGIAVALSISACTRSNPAGPSNTTPPSAGTQVSATISPVPMVVQSVAGLPAARYQLSGEVVFHDSSGSGGRITQMTFTVISDQGPTTSQSVALDLALPPGGGAKQTLSQIVEGPAGQTPSRLQLTAAGKDPTGQPMSVATVQVPLAIAGSASTGPFGHVFVVVEENEGHDDVMGNPRMPYLNSLANQYALATQYHANTHPSIGNYFMMTVGDIVTNSDGYSGIVTNDNIVRQLLAAGKTWKSYAEDLPSVGYTGGDSGLYARRHNVLALLSDVAGSPAQARNLVPFSQFYADLAGNAFPNYSFIVPNLCNDGHDCPLSTADAWLQANIAPLISSSQFQRDGLLIILYDEATDADQAHGGGRVAWVAVSAKAKRGYRSSTFYQHESTLRLTLDALGLAVFPNRAATAPDMREFFTF